MHGNVAEWCEDRYDVAVDPGNPTDGASIAERAIRGGSWGSASRGVRSDFRMGFVPTYRDSQIGFRLAVDSVGPVGGVSREKAGIPEGDPW